MDEDSRFNLTIHPAYGDVVVIPVAVLNHNALGIKPAQAMFMVHLLAAVSRGEKVNLIKISKIMGVARRTLGIWLNDLINAGLHVQPVFAHGLQQPNEYDLDTLLTLLKNTNVTPGYFDELRARFAGNSDAIELIEKLISLDPSVPLGSRDPSANGSKRPTSGRNTLRLDPGIQAINDDDDLHINDREMSSSSLTSVTQQSLVVQMMQLGFSETDAKWQIAQAAKKQIELPAWFEFISNRGSAIRNPAGFLRAKITAGEKPPVVAKPTTSCGHARSYMSGGRCLVCAGVVRV